MILLHTYLIVDDFEKKIFKIVINTSCKFYTQFKLNRTVWLINIKIVIISIFNQINRKNIKIFISIGVNVVLFLLGLAIK